MRIGRILSLLCLAIVGCIVFIGLREYSVTGKFLGVAANSTPYLEIDEPVVYGPSPADAYVPFERAVDINNDDKRDTVLSLTS